MASYQQINGKLKPYTFTEDDAQDAEVIAMVNNNPNCKVNLDTLPPIVMAEDGRLYFMDTTPTPWETFKNVLTVLVVGWAILCAILGAFALVFCLAAELPVPISILRNCTGGILAAALALSAYRGTANEKTQKH